MSDHLVGVAEIAKMLGVSRQRVDQLVSSYADFPKPEAELSAGRIWSKAAIETWIALHPERRPGVSAEDRGKVFERFAEDARRVIVAAQDEAAAAGHDAVGAEHLLAGLLTPATKTHLLEALEDAGLTLEGIRKAISKLAPREPVAESGGFSPAARAVLEEAFREAHRSVRNSITAHDLLVALLRRETPTLQRLGLDPVKLLDLGRELGLRGTSGPLGVTLRPAAIRAGLTRREAEVLRLMEEGNDLREAAESLGVAENTVRNHLRNVSQKLSTAALLSGRSGSRTSEPSSAVTLSDVAQRIEEVIQRLDAIEQRLAG